MKNKIKKLKDNKFMAYAIVISFILITISIIRSAITGITHDEAYTFVNYVTYNPLDVFKGLFATGTMYANNHILNSFLISFFIRIIPIPYCEFIIRLPNIIFYVFYLYFAYKLCLKYEHKFLFFTIVSYFS